MPVFYVSFVGCGRNRYFSAMFHKPSHTLLQGLVVCYWFIDADAIPYNTKMLPDGFSDIMINLGEPYHLVWHDGNTQLVEDSVMFGQRTKPLLLQQPGVVRMIGIRIVPGSEYLFSGMKASDLVNSFVSLTDINGNIADALQALSTTTNDADKIKYTEALLLALLRTDAGAEKALQATHIIMAAKGDVVVEDVALQVAVSYKQLERLFAKHVGISPKAFARVHRFYSAFAQVRALQKANWMQVLHNCGYYDQAHFIKDFSYFSGITPTKQFTAKDTIDDFFGFA